MVIHLLIWIFLKLNRGRKKKSLPFVNFKIIIIIKCERIGNNYIILCKSKITLYTTLLFNLKK